MRNTLEIIHNIIDTLKHTAKPHFQAKTYSIDKPTPSINLNKALLISNELGNEAIVRRWK